MKKRKGAITAEEFLRKLEHDKDYQERKKKREAEFEIIKKNRDQAQAPLVADIRKLGFDISSVYDFVNSANSYPTAIPILVYYLQNDLISEPVIEEGIIRALTVKEAKGIANDVLLATYHKIPRDGIFMNENLRWLIGNAINIIITEKDLEKVIEIVEDTANGTSRQMFVRSLRKFKTERVEDVLISLLDDKEMMPEAVNALGKIKSKKSLSKIESLISDSDQKIRKKIEKALKNIVRL